MERPASFSLAKAWRDVELFKPLSADEERTLVARLHEWVDLTRISRGDVVDLIGFAKLGEIGPRPELKIVNLDKKDGPKREEWHE